MARIVSYSIMLLSAAGAVLCVVGYLLGATRVYVLPAGVQAILLIAVFPLFVPALIVMKRLTRDFKQKDRWRAALRGCPPWMKTTLWIVIGVAFVSFFISGWRDPANFTPLFPVGFYAASFCLMYSWLNVGKFDPNRRCTNGHTVSSLAKFCEECGAPAVPDSSRST